MVKRLGAVVDDDQFCQIAIRMSPVQIGSIEVQILVHEGSCNTCIKEQRGASEGYGVSDTQLRLPDLAIFIQEEDVG